jgi:hypothetical protein
MARGYDGNEYVKGVSPFMRWIDTSGAEYRMVSTGSTMRLQRNTAIEGSATWVDDGLSGGQTRSAIRTVTGTTSASLTDGTILCSATAAMSLTLFSAASATGQIIRVKRVHSGIVTIYGTGSELIDNTSNTVVNVLYQTTVLHSNGSNWYII